MHQRLLISNETKRSFEHLVIEGSNKTKININDISDEVFARLGVGATFSSSNEPIKLLEHLCESGTMTLTSNEQRMLKTALVAKLALNLISSIEKLNLPDSILDLYPQALRKLEDHLMGNETGTYGITDDSYCKDVRFVLGISIPCGAQMVDKNSLVNPVTVMLSAIRLKTIDSALKYFDCKGYGPWFRIHTDVRNLEDFNEQGWNRSYIRIADLLERRENIRGMVGTSWFYDPQLLDISPRLGYLQLRPIEGGAFKLKHRTNRIDIERATAKSKTRKILYEEGKYLPVSYSLLWTRDKMIEWADRNRKAFQEIGKHEIRHTK